MSAAWSSRCILSVVALGAVAVQAPNALLAQVIAPRTVPVQQAGQFDIFPSRLLASGELRAGIV